MSDHHPMDRVSARRGIAMKMHASCIRLPISVTATLLAMTLVAVATGCRRDPQLAVYLDAVNSEKRMLEDRLYELQHKYDEAQKELERLKESGAESRPSRRERARTEPRRTVDELPPPKVKLPTDDSGDDLDLRPPTIDPGQPSKPDQSATPRRSTGETVSRREVRTEFPSGKPKVARIVIDPDQTEGVDRDGRVGDDGLRLALLPLDDQGKFIHEAAPVTVELYDPRDPAE
ncbi:MAG TPA: hypothetical protein ENJ50_08950, partial [Planctomycetaceae bacterium]|nr:hypothetical protein [Planctomycetaceae bacterium]